jgi:hypothetical protein
MYDVYIVTLTSPARDGPLRVRADDRQPLTPLNSRCNIHVSARGLWCTRTTRKSAQAAVWWKGEQETGRHKLVYCPWYLSVRILFLFSHYTHCCCTAYLCTKTRLLQNTRHVSRHLHVATMIPESERGFNYTLTRDKLAMNLGSPPRKLKNVTPASPLPAPAPATKTTTTRPNPASDTTPFPPFEEPTRYELSADNDYRVATLEAQVASLTRKDVESGEFGCYPCLCDSSRCICICISLLVSLPPLPSP